MKFRAIIICILFPLLQASAQEPLRAMSFNIRLNTASDSLNAWTYRKDLVASQVLFHQVHILGVQEALHEQMMDLRQRLPGFLFAGVGRKDGITAGEYSAIFYDTTRFRLIQTNTFWLSETPAIPGSKGWDAAIERIATWVKLSDKKTGIIIFVFNTHFDHVGKEARKQSAELLLRTTEQLAGKQPVILMGDFNATPEDVPIRTLTDSTRKYFLRDAKRLSRLPHYGPSGTFNAFGPREVSDQPIDYIFLSPHFEVLRHASISQTWKGKFASDHFAVFGEMVLRFAYATN